MSGRSVQGEVRGESEKVIRDRDKSRAVVAGVHETVVRLGDEKAVRESIAAGLCPVCGAGPFDSLGNHVPRIHGISAKELRMLAGMLQTESITSDVYRERNVARGKKQYAGVAANLIDGAKRYRVSGQKQLLSKPGRKARKEQLDAIRPTGKGAYDHLPAEVRRERAKRASRARWGGGVSA